MIAPEHPTAFAQWLRAMQLAEQPIIEIAIVGEAGASDTRALLEIARASHRPAQVTAASDAPDSSSVPLLRDRAMIDGVATAYVCRDFACQRPTTDPAELERQLREVTAA